MLSTNTNGYPANLFDRTPVYCSFSHQSDAIALALRMERDVQSRKDLDQRSDGSVELLVRVSRHQ